MNLRIAVANLQSGIGVTEGYRQYVTRGWRYFLPHPGERIIDAGRLLKDEGADIALGMEVQAESKRSRHISQLDTVREHADLPYAHFFSVRQKGDSVNEGSVILSRYPIADARAHPLARRMNPRILGEATLDIAGTPVRVFVAHFALGHAARASQFKEVADIIARTDGPVILGGDFNQRDPAAFEIFRAAGLPHLSFLPNYPSWRPKHALQALFLSEHFEVLHTSIPGESRFSDHLPLIVEAELL